MQERQETWAQPLGREDPLEKEWLPTTIFLSGEFHGLRSLTGYSPWGHRELNMTEGLTLSHSSFPGGASGKEPTCQWRRRKRRGWNLLANAGDTGDTNSIYGSGKSSGEGNGNPLQYSCLENPMDRGAWRATVHGVANSQTWLSD